MSLNPNEPPSPLLILMCRLYMYHHLIDPRTAVQKQAFESSNLQQKAIAQNRMLAAEHFFSPFEYAANYMTIRGFCEIFMMKIP